MKAIGSLVAVHLLLNLLGCFIHNIPGTDGKRGWIMLPLMMLAPSQGAMLGFWTALAGKRASWRGLGAVVGVLAYVWCLDVLGSRNDDWYILFTWLAFGASALLFPARFLGWRIVFGDSAIQQRQQFSLVDALIWMTTFAVLFGAIRWHRWLRGGFQLNSLAIIGSCTAVSLASLWAALGRKWLTTRVLVLFATIGILTGVAMIAVRSLEALLVGLPLTIEAAWIVGSLFVVRLAGYQLTRWPKGDK